MDDWCLYANTDASNRFRLLNQLPRSTVQCDPIFSLRCQYNPQLHSTDIRRPRTREANASGWIEERYKLILQIEQCRVGKGWHERGYGSGNRWAAGTAEVAEHAQCVDDALCSRKSAFSIVAMAARREHSSRHWLSGFSEIRKKRKKIKKKA